MKKFVFFTYLAFFFIFLPAVFALDQIMPLQGVVRQNGANIPCANITNLTIWDAPTGGNLIYNDTFNYSAGGEACAIVNSYMDIMLGNGTNGVDLTLEYGKLYYLDMEINGVDIDFGNRERLPFLSPIGHRMNFIEKIPFSLHSL